MGKPLCRVILESPYAGDVERNRAYLRRCLADSLRRGEAPIASHGLLPGVLDDDVAEDRELGIAAGLAWYVAARSCVVYVDHGISPGMRRGIEEARRFCVEVLERRIGAENWG
jgi:hypothetical protein